jgi:cytochrome c biogenesis factor
MLVELGHFALVLALVVAVLQFLVPVVGVWKGYPGAQAVARHAALLLLALLLFSFGMLTLAFIRNDFTLDYVARQSNTMLPVWYKISAVWGGHEGSLLLWALVLAIWSAAVAVFSRGLPRDMVARVLAILGGISVAFILFILLTSNPFRRLLPDFPPDGNDLNPLLQDPGLIFHPPMLYMGYVGFAVPFAFALAGLMGGRLDSAWARWSRPWTVAAWCFLTCGYRAGVLVGVLRTGLGRLVVLGSGGKCLVHAVAGRHGPDSFTGRDGKAGRLQSVDRHAGHHRLCPQLAGNLSGALRRADIGACVCSRSRARPVRAGDSGGCRWGAR